MKRLVVALVLGLALVVLVSRRAHADPRTSFFSEQLKTNEDYRVRTQAALALGASGDDAAVRPLCDALAGDSNVSVRVAAAAGLGKLAKPAGLACLQTAKAKESTPAVKSQIDKSIGSAQGGGAGAPPPPGADTKYYVAIDITNKSGRAGAEVEGMVRSAMQAKLLARTGFAVAPKGESVALGGQLVKDKKLKGFLLLATVEPPVYEGGNLTQVLRVSMFTYPARALRGDLAPKLTQTGTSRGDVPSENLLIKMCAESAIESFQKVVGTL